MVAHGVGQRCRCLAGQSHLLHRLGVCLVEDCLRAQDLVLLFHGEHLEEMKIDRFGL